MKLSLYVRTCAVMACLPLLALIFSPGQAHAQTTWNATAGAETKDEAVQADGFFPNEVWVIAGDSIEWTFAPKNEVHTVTFLGPAGTVRPSAPPPAGPPPGTAPGSLPKACLTSTTFTGANCVSSLSENGGQTFTVTFSTPGTYKLVCLIHTDMNGTVHVLENTGPNAALLQTKRFYEDEASEEEAALLQQNDGDQQAVNDLPPGNQVLAGIGKIVATGGGTQYRAVVRFLNPVIKIHAGESVTWTNIDPTEPHTVTFGAEPPSPPFTPTQVTANVSVGTDNTLTSTVNCPSTATCDADFVQEGASGAAYVSTAFINSGFLAPATPDRTGSGQTPVGTTRLTITFPVPGDYYYHCALHDVDGMYGEVIVTK